MRIDVVGRGIEITGAIRSHAEQKAEKLSKYYDQVQQVRFTLSKIDHAHHSHFDAELIIDVEHHDDFVAHAQGDDLYGAIDLALQKGVRQLTDFKEKLKTGKR